ncbi:hypothetical protein BCL57_001018 [Agromyces flavus]|uniref:Alpha/beta hydrolase family protein n=1 Tax=Agromyces flavus TaxID=589382 RepID=A0A1H1YZS4_9MICO|nr:hypothetical protein [Agromyces flavus]MCP2366864.1 hypothetical protein [Agromyces flavus]GGI46868.1 hypothetical protein GCM10010932_16790 [Agromyces flavus]SDT26812.1 hypothetical protein SAMN04489721_2942 [Agromyces flavus]
MGDLIVAGPGVTTAVATDELLDDAARFTAAAELLAAWRDRLASVRERAMRDGWAIDRPETLAWAQSALNSCEADARELAGALAASADGYDAAERDSAASRFGERLAAGLLGVMAPGLALSILPAAFGFGSAVAATSLISPETTRAAFAMLFAAHGREVLADPRFVSLVRAVADDADEFVAGLLHSPGLWAGGSGVEVPENASMVVAAAGLVGLVAGTTALVETPVGVRRADPPATSPTGAPSAIAPAPRGIGDLADRVPPSEADAPQVRIERYAGADGPRWVVYSAGTADFTVEPGAEPYDSTSNVHMVAESAGLPTTRGAGERAIRQAMDQAGIAPGDPIVLVGHSAGGLAAANLAADPSLDVVAAVNLGGPIGQVDTGDVPTLSVEHSEDFVPATGGHGVAAPGRIVVERSVGELVHGDAAAVPAHALTAYRGTAEAIDASDDERLREFRARITEFIGTGAAEVTFWRAVRADGEAGTGSAG